jgi:hypothetical protein
MQLLQENTKTRVYNILELLEKINLFLRVDYQ